MSTAKNYLSENEILELNHIVTMWLNFAEDQSKRRQQVFMKDWQDELDSFLTFNDRDVLGSAGKVSHKTAVGQAGKHYEVFAAHRRTLLEADGARASIEALEQAAKQLQETKK